MKNILVHHNDGDPVYIALSDNMAFHVIYKGSSKSSHNSIGMAIEFASNTLLRGEIGGIDEWRIATSESNIA